MASPRASREIGTLFGSELWWKNYYPEIEGHGYRLRPRYHPEWNPSWRISGRDFFAVEDGQPLLSRGVMDATCLRDDRQVILKRVLVGEEQHELKIARLFSSSELRGEPRNHCVPLLDSFELQNVHNEKLMVMPSLRPFDNPPFQTFGEFVAFFSQICDGLGFMHEKNVAHRDCTANNIMFDPSGMYPKGFHPIKINRCKNFKRNAKRYTRTQRPPRYYLIDFGLSRQYSSRDALDEPLRGGDKSAPEHQHGGPCNPFQTDIYYLGNLIREKFTQKYHGFEFMEGLVAEMTHEDPAKRPTIESVIMIFSVIRSSLSTRKLRSLITSRRDPGLINAFRLSKHAIRTILHILLRKAPIPDT
ncbi:kinase-like domain-containing protein [Multifurca ochricompacta]|uniref:Kinase-like domain-containing protein n=1 Tax=Multifurca ochricompacta TaxID=376703 RepID=A0AAD4LZ02_9AGAM|nr:kinase-like domain-containing protein [Multifurca ochricompacta]